MPRYFFDISDDEKLVHDVRGAILAGPQAALEEALTLLPMLAARKRGDTRQHRFVALVMDEDQHTVGRAVLSIHVSGPRQVEDLPVA